MDRKDDMVPLVIYHSPCADGFTAAWSIWKVHPDWEFYPGKYQEDPPDVTDREVWFVDFSYKRPVILEMSAKAKSITILDHHKSAEADLVELPENVSVKFDMEKSGARLAWDCFHPAEDIPMLVNYVEDRDLWRFHFEETKGISAYLFATEYDFENWDFLRKLLENPHEAGEIEGYGNIILKKQTKDINELLQNKFRFKIGGHEVWTANLPYTLCSEAGNILARGEPFGATFYLDGTSAIFSLRSDEGGLDVSEVARLYGGGGHRHAAGFKVPQKLEEL